MNYLGMGLFKEFQMTILKFNLKYNLKPKMKNDSMKNKIVKY